MDFPPEELEMNTSLKCRAFKINGLKWRALGQETRRHSGGATIIVIPSLRGALRCRSKIRALHWGAHFPKSQAI
jgi:hypothetical protein